MKETPLPFDFATLDNARPPRVEVYANIGEETSETIAIFYICVEGLTLKLAQLTAENLTELLNKNAGR